MSGLPSFFQNRGTSVLDELTTDYELGGLEGGLEEEDELGGTIEEGEEDVRNDNTFTETEYDYNDTAALSSFFQSSSMNDNSHYTVEVDEPEHITPLHFTSSEKDKVDLSNLLNNFNWPRKGD